MMKVGIFNARIVCKGEAFGRDDCFVHDGPVALVEFYDTRFMHTPRGQFVTRYTVDTLLGHDGPLDLVGGIDDWSLTSVEVAQVKRWITQGEKS